MLANDSFAQGRMFALQQFLSELVTALVHISARAGKVIVDPRPGRLAEIIRDRQNFIGRFAVIDFIMRKRTGCADGEKLGGDSDEPRKQKLLAIELRTEARHGVK